MTLADDYARVCSTPSDIVEHLPTFVRLVEDLNATHVIELGTRSGVSTIAWLYALEGRGRLTSVDLDPAPPLGDYPHWDFVQGDDLSMKVLERMKPADIILIDTSHHFDQTIVELETYQDLVKPGGVLVCHDTELRRPEGSPERPLFPVKKAIEQFVAAHGLQWFNYRNNNGLGIIQMPGHRVAEIPA